jgi:hypothetical protein
MSPEPEIEASARLRGMREGGSENMDSFIILVVRSPRPAKQMVALR